MPDFRQQIEVKGNSYPYATTAAHQMVIIFSPDTIDMLKALDSNVTL